MEEKFIELANAYEVLSDEEKRQEYDEGNYDDARFTYKEIVEKIYPLMKDKRYDDFVNNYNRIQLQKQEFDLISTETP